MARTRNDTALNDASSTPWNGAQKNVDGIVANPDLNSLLAEEQKSIMNAELATTSLVYDFHRSASRKVRQLINDTQYPEHEPHVFSDERAERKCKHAENLAVLTSAADTSERLLAFEYAEGRVSGKAFQSRSRSLRQDRAKLADASQFRAPLRLP